MGVLCRILLYHPPGESYRPGHSVTGIVKYLTDKPTDFVDITVSLTGKGNCSWYEKDGKHWRSHCGSEELVNVKTSILTRDTGGVPVQVPGEYQKEFHFILPENLPSTYEDDICEIRYNVRVHFVKRRPYKPEKRFKIAIAVRAHVKTILPQEPASTQLEKRLFKLFSKKKQVINVSAEIQEPLIESGDAFNLKIIATNNSSFRIVYMKIELLQKLTYTSNGGHRKRKSFVLRESTVMLPSMSGRETVAFSTTVTTNPGRLQTLQHSSIFSIDYKLIMTVVLPPLHGDRSMTIPVVIADVVNVCELENDSFIIDSIDDDPPPSYWQVMAEDWKRV